MVSHEIHKERVKLRATFVNGLAIGLFTAGVLTPALATVLNPNVSPVGVLLAFLAAIVCFVLCFIPHLYATRHLAELDNELE